MRKARFALSIVFGFLIVSCSVRKDLVEPNGAGPGDTGGGAGDAGREEGHVGADGARDGQTDSQIAGQPSPLEISPREAVTRVARVLWESPPDEGLVAMADSGAATTDVDVRRVARSMLDDPRSRVGVGSFYRWWLMLDALASVPKDPTLFPEYSSAVGAMMVSEAETFGVAVTLDDDGRFHTLMQASYSFVNETLANLYGLTGVTGPDLRKVDLDPTRRAGIFTRLAILTEHAHGAKGLGEWTSPTGRGLFIAVKMLCEPIAPPPPNTSPVPAPVPGSPPQTNRQRLMETTAAPACAACHSLFDPIGFAYEGFDSIGRARLTDSGLPIDSSGSVALASGEYAWSGATDLAQILANLPEAHACMGSQWLEYMLGRALTDADMPSVAVIGQIFEASNLDLRALIAASASSPAFLAPDGGTPCTPGLDSTCNDDPAISAPRGTCTPAGKCACSTTSVVNGATGRCL